MGPPPPSPETNLQRRPPEPVARIHVSIALLQAAGELRQVPAGSRGRQLVAAGLGHASGPVPAGQGMGAPQQPGQGWAPAADLVVNTRKSAPCQAPAPRSHVTAPPSRGAPGERAQLRAPLRAPARPAAWLRPPRLLPPPRLFLKRKNFGRFLSRAPAHILTARI